jgi:nucleolar protein 4
VSERGLKRLAIHAKRAFDDEIKAGTRVPLSMDELEITEAEREALDSAKGKKNKHKGRPTGVKQAKIVRQADRVDMLTGKGRSKGYGFVEMDAHADALRVLRWLNNNRDAHKLLWAWWREEVADLAQARKEQLKGLGTGGGAPKSAPNGAKNASQPAPMSAAVQREELETRVKKLEARAAEMKVHDPEVSIKDGRTLHAEFSVENITVVKRRREKEATGDVDRPLPVKVWPELHSCSSCSSTCCLLNPLFRNPRSDSHQTSGGVLKRQNAPRRR